MKARSLAGIDQGFCGLEGTKSPPTRRRLIDLKAIQVKAAYTSHTA